MTMSISPGWTSIAASADIRSPSSIGDACVRWPAKLYNRTFVPGQRSTVTADFGERLRKTSVRIATGGTNFRRRVLVEASEDGKSFQILRDGAFLFRVASAAAGKGYERSTVNLPENHKGTHAIA